MVIYCGHCGVRQPTESNNTDGNFPCVNCGKHIPTYRESIGTSSEFRLYCYGCGDAVAFSILREGEYQSCPRCWSAIELPPLATQPTNVSANGSLLVKAAVPVDSLQEPNLGLPGATLEDERLYADTGAMCAFCQTAIFVGEDESYSCPECETPYHKECWEENEGCAVYGCDVAPETEHLRSIEIPMSYWGQEHKPCPNCNEEILAAALRCRHCGSVFHTAAPIETETFQELEERGKRLPALRGKVMLRVALCIFPFTALFALPFTWMWYRKNQSDIRALPALYEGLCKVAIAVALIQVIIAFVAISIISNTL